MNTTEDGSKLLKIVQMLYGLLGLRFSEEAAAMGLHPETMQYFSFAADWYLVSIRADDLNGLHVRA